MTLGGSATRTSALGLAAGAVFVLFAALLLYAMTLPPLDDYDEGMYAEIAREMVVTGDWLTPHANGVRHLDKPPLLFWLMAASYSAFGVSAIAARLPTALAALWSLLVTYWLGRELYGPRCGLAAAAILASFFGFLIYATVITTDMLFSALLSTCLLCLLLGYLRGRETHLTAAFVAAALATLAKSPMGIILPALTFGLFLLATRQRWPWSAGRLTWGAGLYGLLAVPWFVAAADTNEGFARFYFLGEHIQRLLNTRPIHDSVPLSLSAFLGVSLVWLLPWSTFVPQAARQAARDMGRSGAERGKRARLLLPIWVAVVMIFFSLVRLRLENYSLLAWPAAAVLLAALFVGPEGERRHPLSLAWPLAGLLALQLLAWLAATWPESCCDWGRELIAVVDGHYRTMRHGIYRGARVVYPDLDRMLGVVRLILLSLGAGTGAACLAALARRRAWAVAAISAGMLAAFFFTQEGRVLFGTTRSSSELAAALRNAGPAAVVCDGPYEKYSSLGFYSGRKLLVLDGRRGFLEWGSRFPEAAGAFIDRAELARLWQGRGRVFLATDSVDWQQRFEQLGPVTPVAVSGKAILLTNRAQPGP